jgi:XRE family transcriptional regulator, aerobic/anaerobic benzoate catabolism transcriptional regulator
VRKRVNTAEDAPEPSAVPAEVNDRFAERLARLGTRVRELRARRGMSRKVLSELSNVSQRYLAQLESGQANASLSILVSLAETMDTDVTALLSDPAEQNPDLLLARQLLDKLSPADQSAAYAMLRNRFSSGQAPKTRVALIGLRGGGKTTLGPMVARHFGVPFIRVTRLVEVTSGMDMPEIFMTVGQSGYRRLEFNALQTAVSENPRAVIETGGSLVSEAETFEYLLSHCFTVWLKASPEDHMARVMEQGDTRMIEGHYQSAMEDLRAMLEARRIFYARADAELDTSRRSVEECARDLIAMCEPFLAP